jgi:two-component system response regulator FixJ
MAEGHDCRTYASGREFLADLPDLARGIVFLDVRMPQMSGLEVLERLKAIKPDWAAVMITGHGDVEVAAEAQRLGALALLEKPFDAGIMNDMVERAFAQPAADLEPSTR